MGTQAGFAFAMGLEYGTFDMPLGVICKYKEQFEAEQEEEIHIPSSGDKLFNPDAKPHTFKPFAKEIEILTRAMELVERARELTIQAITQSGDEYEEPIPVDWE